MIQTCLVCGSLISKPSEEVAIPTGGGAFVGKNRKKATPDFYV